VTPEQAIDPGWSGLALAAILMVAVTGAAFAVGVNMIKDNLIATARATVQLLVVGLILGYVFAFDHWYGVVGALVIMTLVASLTASQRVDKALGKLAPLFTLVLAAVTAIALIYVTQVTIGLHSVRARYLIPLGGMILGNAMTAGTLAASRFVDELRSGREVIEAALALGASPAQATRGFLRQAFLAGVTPVLNAMLIVGIVKMPGIMTGQMLGGADPMIAAKYQLVVMFMLAFGDGLTALLILLAIRRLAFTRAWQPRL
jgi:putative ABC transport system permease protein